MLYWKQLKILAGLSAAETMRQPVCLLLTLCCVVFTVTTPLVTVHNFGEGGRLARDSGLAFQFMFGLFLSGYAACAAMARERRSGTAAVVLSKPVSRGTFFTATFLGIATVIGLFSTTAALATLLAERIALRFTISSGYSVDLLTAVLALGCPVLACTIGGWLNFRSGRVFQSTALVLLPLLLAGVAALSGGFSRTGTWTPYAPTLQWQIIPAAILVLLGLMMLAAIALSLAVRLSLVPTVCICFGLLLLGLTSDALIGPHAAAESSPACFHWATTLAYAAIPNWQHFWAADAISHGGHIPMLTLAQTVFYAILYTSGILCLGQAAFQHTEIS